MSGKKTAISAILTAAILAVPVWAHADGNTVIGKWTCSKWLQRSCDNWDESHDRKAMKGAKCLTDPREAVEALEYFHSYLPDQVPKQIVTECLPGSGNNAGQLQSGLARKQEQARRDQERSLEMARRETQAELARQAEWLRQDKARDQAEIDAWKRANPECERCAAR